MKRLRVLTGHHAGAELSLTSGQHRIGNTPECDVFLNDWQGAELLMTVTDDQEGAIAARLPEDDDVSAAAAPLETVILMEKIPLAFGETVLCVGEDLQPWPSDLMLLQSMINAPEEPPQLPVAPHVTPEEATKKGDRLKTRLSLAATVLFGCVITSAVYWWGAHPRPVAESVAPTQAQVMASRLREEFARTGLTELKVVEANGRLAVVGMVADANQHARAHTLIDREAPFPIDARFSVASDIVQALQSSLGNPDVSVRYEGDGQFLVQGSATSPDTLRAQIARVREDLGPNIKQITVESTEVKPEGPRYSTLLTQGNFGYMQTEDGVKHIFIGGVESMPPNLNRSTGEKR